MSNLFHVIVKPRLRTEKATFLKANNEYVFEVLRSATKPQIKAAVEELLQVKVERVNTLIVPGKKKRRGATSPYKKAIVKLKDGYSFNEYALEFLDEPNDEQ